MRPPRQALPSFRGKMALCRGLFLETLQLWSSVATHSPRLKDRLIDPPAKLTYVTRHCLTKPRSPTFKLGNAFVQEGCHPLFEITGAATGALQARFQLKLVFFGIGKALTNGRFHMAIGFCGPRG